MCDIEQAQTKAAAFLDEVQNRLDDRDEPSTGERGAGAIIGRRQRLGSPLGMPRSARIALGGLVQARQPAANRGCV